MKNKLAPIVLFVYNRPWHTRKTVEALQKNIFASDSELFVYSDNAKNEKVQDDVMEVRKYIKMIKGFEKVVIIEQKKNVGLANSIISGVTEIVNKYGKIIVLEDDLVTSPYFLKFMNEALDFYENEKMVWHISGWNYPINTDGLDDVFMWRLMNCWGWATWSDRWRHYEKNVVKVVNEFNKDDIYKFDIDGVGDFWNQIILNKKNKIDTWAIFWYVTIFKQGGLCVNSSKTFTTSIGNDDSGTNCSENNDFDGVLSQDDNFYFEIELEEDIIALNRVRQFYKKRQSILRKIINKKWLS